jgi:hypothetical protein
MTEEEELKELKKRIEKLEEKGKDVAVPVLPMPCNPRYPQPPWYPGIPVYPYPYWQWIPYIWC